MNFCVKIKIEKTKITRKQQNKPLSIFKLIYIGITSTIKFVKHCISQTQKIASVAKTVPTPVGKSANIAKITAHDAKQTKIGETKIPDIENAPNQ